MPVSDLDGARVALRDGKPAELLGLAECGWLDAKDGVYQLDDPAKAEELVKDVAGFANAKAGGLLLVGVSTRKEHDREILDQVRPVPRALVDLDRHRKLIRERVIPPPRGVSVEWIDCGQGTGVLMVDVPAQPPACLPYVVPGPGGDCQPRVGGGPGPGGRRDTVAAAGRDPAPSGRRMGGHGRPQRGVPDWPDRASGHGGPPGTAVRRVGLPDR